MVMQDIPVPREETRAPAPCCQPEFELTATQSGLSRDAVKMGAEIGVRYHRQGTQVNESDERVLDSAYEAIKIVIGKTPAEEIYKAASNPIAKHSFQKQA